MFIVRFVSILNIFLFIFFVLFTTISFKYLAIHNDQINNCLQPFLSFSDHGNIIISHINRLVTYTIPRLIGYNIIDWQSDVIKYFRSFILVSIAFCFSKCAFINMKENILRPLLFIICYLSIISILIYTDGWQIECACGFGRFIIVNLFLVLFWYNFAKIYISQDYKKNIINKKVIISLSLFALCLGNMSEPLAFSSFLALLFLLSVNLFENIIYKRANNVNKIESDVQQNQERFYNIKSLILYTSFFIFLGGCFMFFSKEYLLDNIVSHSGNVSLSTIISSLSLYKEFFVSYFNNIIKVHWIILSLLFVIFISFPFIKDKESKRTLIMSFSITIALLIFYMFFIFSRGDLNSSDSILNYYLNDFWLNHHDFPVIIRLELLMILMFAISALLRTIKNNQFMIILFSLLMILGIIFNILNTDYKKASENFIEKTYIYKKDMYIIDKIMINSYENSRTPILFLSEYNENYPNMDVKCYYNYFDKIYGIEIDINKIKFVDKEASLNNFYKNGGNFTEEEFKSLKFSKLYDIRNLRKKKIKFYPIFKWQQIDKEQ